MSHWQFIKQFSLSPRTIGAIAPSSTALANYMIKTIDFEKAKVIVEYGPGTGVFTRKILEKFDINKNIFFGFELDEKLNRLVNEQIPEITMYQDSASEIRKYLKQYNVSHADAIVSGLPWAAFPETLQNEILSETIEALPEGGIFNTFAYVHGLVLPAAKKFRKKLNKHFSEVKISPVVWRNLPPAIVYWCKK